MTPHDRRREGFIGDQDENEFAVWEIVVPHRLSGRRKMGFYLCTFGEAVDFAFENGLGSDGFNDLDWNKVQKVQIYRIPDDWKKDKWQLEAEIEELQYQIADREDKLKDVTKLNMVSSEDLLGLKISDE